MLISGTTTSGPGASRERYDAIIFPHNYLGIQDQIRGIDKKWGPLPYTKTKEFPSLGVSTPRGTSRAGSAGAAWPTSRRISPKAGGRSRSATAWRSPSTAGSSAMFTAKGALSLRRVELGVKFVRPGHPLAYGYPETTSAFRTMLPVYDTAVSARGGVVLQWGTKLRAEDREETGPEAAKPKDAKDQAKKEEPKMLVAGALKGEDVLEGRPAILDLPAGKGRVIAYNFEPIHRDLDRSDFRFLWNALLNWNALPPAEK